MSELAKDYLVECFTSARSEAEMVLKSQDDILKLQLVMQAIMWALTKKIKLFGVESGEALSEVLLLAVPLSFIFFCLYVSQDSLLHYLSQYLGNLSRLEAAVSERNFIIPNWNSSSELKAYMTSDPLLLRFFVLSVAFLVIPNYLLFYYAKASYPNMDLLERIFCAFQVLLSVVMLIAGIKAYDRRRRDVENIVKY